jgi:hypothetical protein
MFTAVGCKYKTQDEGVRCEPKPAKGKSASFREQVPDAESPAPPVRARSEILPV